MNDNANVAGSRRRDAWIGIHEIEIHGRGSTRSSYSPGNPTSSAIKASRQIAKSGKKIFLPQIFRR